MISTDYPVWDMDLGEKYYKSAAKEIRQEISRLESKLLECQKMIARCDWRELVNTGKV